MKKSISVCFWGVFFKEHFRNYVFIDGLKKLGLKVEVCNKDVSKLYDFIVLNGDKKLKNKFFVAFNIAFIFLMKFFVYLSLCLRFAFKYRSCDVIITGCDYDQDVIWAKFLARLFNKKLIFNALNSNYETSVIDRGKIKADSFLGKNILRIDKKSFKHPDIIIADTNEHKKYFAAKFNTDKDKCKVIYVGADEKVFNGKYDGGCPKDPFNVVFYGIYTPLHGIEYMVDAANILKGENIKFMFIGDGQKKEDIEEKIEKLKLNNVEFVDYLKSVDLVNKLKKCDLGLGIFGGTEKCGRVIPNKVFQMMLLGLPVITGDTPAIREVFKDKEHCLLCKTADGADLAEKIMLIKNDKELRDKISQNGRNLVLKEFNTGKISEELYNIIKELESSCKGQGSREL